MARLTPSIKKDLEAMSFVYSYLSKFPGQTINRVWLDSDFNETTIRRSVRNLVKIGSVDVFNRVVGDFDISYIERIMIENHKGKLDKREKIMAEKRDLELKERIEKIKNFLLRKCNGWTRITHRDFSLCLGFSTTSAHQQSLEHLIKTGFVEVRKARISEFSNSYVLEYRLK